MKTQGQHIDMMAPMVGGNWNNGSNAGVFTLNLNNARTNSNDNVGGRDSISMPDAPDGDTGKRGMCCPAVSEINPAASCSRTTEARRRNPKRHGALFECAFTIENLYSGYIDARKKKRKKAGTFAFERSLWPNLLALHEEVHSGEYRPLPYRKFEVFEPKQRTIYAPHFRDLVVQHAIYRVIYEIFDQTFIDQSFACRKGGGTHKVSCYTQEQMRLYDGDLYYVKLDVRKFFYRIDRGVLRVLFERKVKDRRMVDVMMMFANMEGDVGIPIGNLLSQLYALIYLNPLDHFIKRELKARSYVRYVDDFVIIGVTLDEAKRMKQRIEEFLHVKLKLELSHWTISKIRRGINFVGYRTWKRKKFVRKHSMFRFSRAVKAGKKDVIVSLIGHARHSASMPYFRKILERYGAFDQIPKGAQKCFDTFSTHGRQ
ncbi:MAG: group II intron reverse transcriptase domain-containing protein [Campylobacterales bacterium]|nr:group II intron reverse transcriptase domain-containing protein [Campylobacterales bacterium]